MTDLLRKHLQERGQHAERIFFNCGPEAMIDAAVALEKEYVSPENIYYSIDYLTKCGGGLCGSCATRDGRRLCVDGPFLK